MLRAALEGWTPLPLQDALKTAREAVGALGDSAEVSGSAPGDDKASLAAQIAALRRLQAAQKGLQGQAGIIHLANMSLHMQVAEDASAVRPISGACSKSQSFSCAPLLAMTTNCIDMPQTMYVPLWNRQLHVLGRCNAAAERQWRRRRGWR